MEGSGGGLFSARYAVDMARSAAVEENPDGERAALLLLLSLRQGNPSWGEAPLNANPLLRTAASKCMPRLALQLVTSGGAEVNTADPRFGGTALDRAEAAGCRSVVQKLLALGAARGGGVAGRGA